MTLKQTGCGITGSDQFGDPIAGTLSGNSLKWTIGTGANTVFAQSVIAPDGKSSTGTFMFVNDADSGTIETTRVSGAADNADRAPSATTAACQKKVVLSGTVFEHKCEGKRVGKSCRHQTPAPVAGERVVVAGSRKTYETESHAKGVWSLKVPRGSYTVRLEAYDKDEVKPDSRRVDARANRSGLDFTICRPPENYHGPKLDPQDRSKSTVRLSAATGSRTSSSASMSIVKAIWRIKPIRVWAVRDLHRAGSGHLLPDRNGER